MVQILRTGKLGSELRTATESKRKQQNDYSSHNNHAPRHKP